MSGSIFVQIPKVNYEPGEQVNGFIYLTVNSSIQTSQVSLRVTGIEEVKLCEARAMTHDEYISKWSNHHNDLIRNVFSDNEWSVTTQSLWEISPIQFSESKGIDDKVISKETRTVTLDHYANNEVFNHQFPCYLAPNGFLNPGQYSIPFSFMLPHGIPASFKHTWNENGRFCFGDTSYKIMAYISHGGFLGFFKSDIKSVTRFVVNQPAVQENGMVSRKLNKQVTSCCCISKGQIDMKCYFEKNNYTAGETAYIITEVDGTNLKCDIKSFRGNFKQNMVFKTRHYTKYFANALSQVIIAGVQAGSKHMGENALRHPILLADNISGGQIQPTSHGQLIVNRYSLQSTVDVDATICCDSHPTIELDANLFNKAGQIQAWNAPSNWKPIVTDPYVAQFGSEFLSNTDSYAVHSNPPVLKQQAFPGQTQGVLPEQKKKIPDQKKNKFPEQEQGGFPGQQQGGFPDQNQGGFPGQEQGGFPGQNQGGFPGQEQGGFPGQQQGGFPGQEQGGFPGQF